MIRRRLTATRWEIGKTASLLSQRRRLFALRAPTPRLLSASFSVIHSRPLPSRVGKQTAPLIDLSRLSSTNSSLLPRRDVVKPELRSVSSSFCLSRVLHTVIVRLQIWASVYSEPGASDLSVLDGGSCERKVMNY